MKAYKTEIHPTEEQRRHIEQTFSACRYVFNQYIAANQKAHEAGEKFISGYTFSKYLNNGFRVEHPECSWLREVSSKALKFSIMNAEKAFKRFFRTKRGFPNFKSKKAPRQSYSLISDPGVVRAERHRIYLPMLKWVRLKEFGYIPSGAIISSASVSYEAGRYYVSALVKTTAAEPASPNNEGVGVDLGIKSFAVTSQGEVFENINKARSAKRAERRVRREQRKVSRKVHKGEATERRANLRKQVHKLRVAHKRVRNIRTDYIKKVAAALVKAKPKYIVLEDLNISGMMKNRHLSKAIQKQCFFTFREVLTTMCEAAGVAMIIADRFFASSKICSSCGQKHARLRLKDRTFNCPSCGFSIDRDLNAAVNLKNYGAPLVS